MHSTVGASAEIWRRQSAIQAVMFWSLGSVVFTLLTAFAASYWASPRILTIWSLAQIAIAAAAYGAVWYMRRDSEKAYVAARAILICSALSWGAACVTMGTLPNLSYNLPMLLTIVGLATASVWLFAAELHLLLAVVLVLLAPMLFLLLGGRESEWIAAMVSVALVIGNLLISRHVSTGVGDAAVAPMPSSSRLPAASVTPVTAIADNAELLHLRAELERHRNLEKEMVAAKQAAEGANMAKGEFLATMSHEIRTPLNGIIPLLEILKDTRLEPDQRDYLNTAYTSSRHLLRIIDDILDYSKIEANKLELEQVGINLKELLDSVSRLMEKTAEAKGLRMSVSFDPNVRLAVRGDPVRLRQVLSNLVSNAIKFTEKGSVSIQISKRSETRTHSELMFAVRDTGVGVSPEKAGKLFQPFAQADTSTTRNYGGTGLGLVICKRVVELMGGKIGLKSEAGKGSVFWFSVPFLKAIGDVSSNRRDLSGSRALLVGSDTRLIQRLTGLCQSWGMSQIATNTAADALSKLKSSATLGDNWSFDVVIVDLGTMKPTAPALARNVMREPVLERLKILFIEGDDPAPAEFAQDSPRTAVVKRSFNESELTALLNKLLEVDGGGERRFNLLEEAARLGMDSSPEPRSATDVRSATAAPDPGPDAVLSKLSGHALLVEDNPVNRQVAQRLLSLISITFEVAENGKEAFDMMGKGGFDVVLMDCQMPVMDGYTATRSRRTLEQERSLPRVPIIAMTANAMAGDREKCLASGMDDYMSKPLNRGLLEQTIRKWLPKNRKPAADAPAVARVVAPAPAPVRISEPVRMTQSIPAINEAIVNELIDVMGSEFTSLVRVYLEDTPKNLAILTAAAERNDPQGMIAPAHSLKSTSANLGAMALSDVAKLVEHGARAGTLRDSIGMARQANIEFRRASDELQRLLKSADG